jgi:uncharacterized membrane protein YdjX (TVP38/TMEM64 family)
MFFLGKIKIKINYKRLVVWVVMTTILIILYNLKNEWFDISFLEGVVENHRIWAMLIYVIILLVISIFLIPSTPFAVAGVVIFYPLEAFVLNLVGILISSVIVYYFARYLGIKDIFETKYAKKLKKVKKALSKKELPIIIGWSFFPVAPTDLIIYACSVLNISLKKCLIGVLIGEGILNFFYIFSIDIMINF